MCMYALIIVTSNKNLHFINTFIIIYYYTFQNYNTKIVDVSRARTLRLKPPSNKSVTEHYNVLIVQELCESRGGRPGLFVLTSLLVSVDVKIY